MRSALWNPLGLLMQPCDIELQGETVYAVADRLQQLGVPYLFTTGYEATEIPDRYRLALRFEKPVGTGAILDALRDQVVRLTS